MNIERRGEWLIIRLPDLHVEVKVPWTDADDEAVQRLFDNPAVLAKAEELADALLGRRREDAHSRLGRVALIVTARRYLERATRIEYEATGKPYVPGEISEGLLRFLSKPERPATFDQGGHVPPGAATAVNVARGAVSVSANVSPPASESAIQEAVRRALDPAMQALVDRLRSQLGSRVCRPEWHGFRRYLSGDTTRCWFCDRVLP